MANKVYEMDDPAGDLALMRMAEGRRQQRQAEVYDVMRDRDPGLPRVSDMIARDPGLGPIAKRYSSQSADMLDRDPGLPKVSDMIDRDPGLGPIAKRYSSQAADMKDRDPGIRNVSAMVDRDPTPRTFNTTPNYQRQRNYGELPKQRSYSSFAEFFGK
jgi:hypothetical protein